MSVYASTGSFNHETIRLGTFNDVNMAPGQILTGTLNSPIRSGWNVDESLSVSFSLSGVVESNRLNNVVLKTVPLIEIPDLIPYALYERSRGSLPFGYVRLPIDDLHNPPLTVYGRNLVSGETVTTQWEVYTGDAASAAQIREDAFYWSKNTRYDTNDILAARVTPTLPTEYVWRTVTVANVVLPEAGYWYLLLRVDDRNTIAETNEANND